MKNRLFTYAILILFFTPALAAGQNLSDQIITASVFYTDEMMFSTRSDTVESMLVGIAVSKKAQDSAFEAQNSAAAEITYTEHTDTIRVKTLAQVQGRQYLVGLECRCHREFDETDQKRQAK